MLLQGLTAIITGAASQRGLGRAAAALFARHGARVAILDLDQAAAASAAASLATGSEGAARAGTHIGLACDVAHKSQCEQTVAAALKAFGHIDILLNNAGISQARKLADITPGDYEAVTNINLRGTLYMTQAVLPHMRQRRSGSIINMSSVSGQRGGGIFGGPHYAAAKAGVLGLTKASARELAPDGIRVNAICPSLIDTDITVGMSETRRAEIVGQIPMGRAGRPEEVAGCCLFLASALSSYVTGSEIDVNGGSHIH